jgi:hypothetical protein
MASWRPIGRAGLQRLIEMIVAESAERARPHWSLPPR